MEQSHSRLKHWLPLGVMVLLTAALGVTGQYFFLHQRADLRRQVEQELLAVAEAKVHQISDWRRERLSDANYILRNREIALEAKLCARIGIRGGGAVTPPDWMKAMFQSGKYYEILLTDPAGNEWCALPASASVDETTARLIDSALIGCKVIVSDLYLDDSRLPRMDFVVPLFEVLPQGSTMVGAAVLRVDPYTSLFPLIANWPTSRKTGDIQIVRADGNDVMYLNPLRHSVFEPVSFRLPLATSRAPAALAVRGLDGVTVGSDFRGVQVIAAMKRVPGTIWSVVVKVDESEVYSLLTRYALMVGIIVIVLSFGTGMLLMQLWSGERRREEAKLRKSEHRMRTTLDNMMEGCQIIGHDWRYLYVNGAAEQHGRRPKAELLGHVFMDLWPGVEATDLFAAMRECMDKRVPRRMETYFIYPDWQGAWFDLTIQPVPEGIFILSIDISERKQIEIDLLNSRAEFRRLAGHLQSVREEERKHIAREIHDELGQLLTALKIDLSWIQTRLRRADGGLGEKTKAMADLINSAVETGRRIARELRPGPLEELGLLAALEWLTQDFRKRTGVRCKLTAQFPEERIEPELATALFRICQEALNNVARHAHALDVDIALTYAGDGILLHVEDNGAGFVVARGLKSGSFGLLGIRERAEYFGGRAEFSSAIGKGTTIKITMPLKHCEAGV